MRNQEPFLLPVGLPLIRSAEARAIFSPALECPIRPSLHSFYQLPLRTPENSFLPRITIYCS